MRDWVRKINKNQVYKLKKIRGFDRSQIRWDIKIEVKLKLLDDSHYVASALMFLLQRLCYYK